MSFIKSHWRRGLWLPIYSDSAHVCSQIEISVSSSNMVRSIEEISLTCTYDSMTPQSYSSGERTGVTESTQGDAVCDSD